MKYLPNLCSSDGPGKTIEHSDGSWDEAQVSQTWALQAVSVTGAQIISVLQKAPNMQGKFTSFQSDGKYISYHISVVLDEELTQI